MRKPRHSSFDCTPGCSVEAAISLIDGKWKCVILFHLLEGTARFSEIRRRVGGATQRTLTNQLRELEADGLIVRTVYAQVPPKVEYSLTTTGEELRSLLSSLAKWAQTHMPALRAGILRAGTAKAAK